MTSKFQLPGAERFSKHLEGICDGVLSVEGPEIVDRSYGGKYAQKWVVKLDGEQLGEYFTFGPKPGETEFGRQFSGRVPGYVNESVVAGNKHKSEDERIPEDTVSLSYANQRLKHKICIKDLGD